jgi:aminoglycoside phosphotransferase
MILAAAEADMKFGSTDPIFYPARTAVQVLRLLSAVANAYIAHGVICSPDILVAAWNSRTALEENCL